MVDTKCEQFVVSKWICPECSGMLIASRGFIVCTECGLAISRQYVSPTYQIENRPKQNAHDAEMFVSLGARLHIVDGLGSYIDFHKNLYFRDSHGRALESKSQKKFKRLKSVYSSRIRIGRNEAKYRALRTLNRVAKLLMLSEIVRDRTAYLYKKIVNTPVTKTSNNILLMAVCLLIAVREFKEDAPITLEEIAEVFERCGHRVSVRAMVREALRLKSLTGYAPLVRNPQDYIPRVISLLMNDSNVRKRITTRGWKPNIYANKLRDMTIQIIKMIPSSKRGGRNPFIFAVSAAYAADRLISTTTGMKQSLTQKLVSNATHVAEYSIRDHYGMIKKIILEH